MVMMARISWDLMEHFLMFFSSPFGSISWSQTDVPNSTNRRVQHVPPNKHVVDSTVIGTKQDTVEHQKIMI